MILLTMSWYKWHSQNLGTFSFFRLRISILRFVPKSVQSKAAISFCDKYEEWENELCEKWGSSGVCFVFYCLISEENRHILWGYLHSIGVVLRKCCYFKIDMFFPSACLNTQDSGSRDSSKPPHLEISLSIYPSDAFCLLYEWRTFML